MQEYTFTKDANLDRLTSEIRQSSVGSKLCYLKQFGTSLTITCSEELTTQEQDDLSTIITNHVVVTPVQQLTAYLDNLIFPFVKNLINTFAAENIAMGITQAGKAGVLLGIFTKQYDIHNNGFPISLKSAFDTGSLYEARAVIQYLRDNPTQFDGLSPYVTDAMLLKMKNEIETVLGITPLST